MTHLWNFVEIVAALVILARTLAVLDGMSWRSLKARPLLVISWVVLGCGALLAITAPLAASQLPEYAHALIIVGLAGWMVSERRHGTMRGGSRRAPP